MLVQLSASACSLMQRIQVHPFVISAWQAGSHNTVQENVQYRPDDFLSLQAADILMHSDTLASNQIKQVIYARPCMASA
jgi:hypothetical protein